MEAVRKGWEGMRGWRVIDGWNRAPCILALVTHLVSTEAA